MKKIVFITPPDAAYGFSLAGVPQCAVAAPEAEDTLRTTMSDPETGLIVLDERLITSAQAGQGVPAEYLQDLERGWHGILLVLPAPIKPPEEVEDYAARLIRRAIGYHVRLKL